MSATRSKFSCPACGVNLHTEPVKVHTHDDIFPAILLWCAEGPCQSEAANIGSVALTESLAFDALATTVEAEAQHRNVR